MHGLEWKRASFKMLTIGAGIFIPAFSHKRILWIFTVTKISMIVKIKLEFIVKCEISLRLSLVSWHITFHKVSDAYEVLSVFNHHFITGLGLLLRPMVKEFWKSSRAVVVVLFWLTGYIKAVLWSRNHDLETRVHWSSFCPGLGLGLETWRPMSRSWSWDLKKVLTTTLY